MRYLRKKYAISTDLLLAIAKEKSGKSISVDLADTLLLISFYFFICFLKIWIDPELLHHLEVSFHTFEPK